MNESAFSAATSIALAHVDWPRAASEGIAVALVELETWRPWLLDAHAALDPDESARVQRQRFTRNRDLLALAYALRRVWLARALRIPVHEVSVGYDGHGCPVLPGGRYRFSLSHAGGLAAFALSAWGPLGVDIEPIDRTAAMAEISDFICAPGEPVVPASSDAQARDVALLELWVRKEALLKAAGTGLDQEMRSFLAPRDRSLPLPGADSATRVQVTMIEVGSRGRAAVAGVPGLPVTAIWICCGREPD